MDSTVQTVQEVGNQVSQYRQMFENYLPDITKFGIKVVLAIVAFWVGSTVIKWIVKFVRKSLTKSRLDYRSGTVYVLTGQDRTLHTPDL